MAFGASFAGSCSKNMLFERFWRAFGCTGRFCWALAPGSRKPKKPGVVCSLHLGARSLGPFRSLLGLGGVQYPESYIGGVSFTVSLKSLVVSSACFGSSRGNFGKRSLISRGKFESK